MKNKKFHYDFSGYATKNDIVCTDGRIIRHDAFKHMDGAIVPMVYMHSHDDLSNVIGKCKLENRSDGVIAYGQFNDTENGKIARQLVEHGDVTALSIFANHLKQKGSNVLHGDIKEVSLVLAGANPGASIDNVIIQHSDDSFEEIPDEAILQFNMPGNVIVHYDGDLDDEDPTSGELVHADKETDDDEGKDDKGMADKEFNVTAALDSLNDDQKVAVYALMKTVLADHGVDLDDEDDGEVEHDDFYEGDFKMKRNVFDGDVVETIDDGVLSHDDFNDLIDTAVSAAKRNHSDLKTELLAHAEERYGIDNLDYLFPDVQALESDPTFIQRDQEWVGDFMTNTSHSPYARFKSLAANITADEARAKGYITGKRKKDEVFSLLKRETVPTTVYKKQRLDRDTIIDAAHFDVVAFLRNEMDLMLREEIARAALVGDGRLSSSEDKISETNIRPIWKDDDLYAVHVPVYVAADATDEDKAKALIKATIKNRKKYKGSGSPRLYTTEDIVTGALLLTDGMGRDLYENVEKIATKTRSSKVISVEVMDNCARTVDGVRHELAAIQVNPKDYNFGTDNGGQKSMFDDFNINYNQYEYLIETRTSGALRKPYSALVYEFVVKQNPTPDPETPSDDPETPTEGQD
jgi:hypothetical protein